MFTPESHVFCTSVKCAAVVYVFGGKFRQPDPITIEILPDESENIRFWFHGAPVQGFAIADIIAAYSILTRGVPPGFQPKKEVLAICADKQHPIHPCFLALNERDRLHRLYLDAAAGKSTYAGGVFYTTNLTKLAACLVSLGHKEAGCSWDGKSAHFQFPDTRELRALVEAYEAAWVTMMLEASHPLYWMKSVLDRRDEILRDKRRVEPHYREDRGTKTILTPIHASKEDIEKSKKYINA